MTRLRVLIFKDREDSTVQEDSGALHGADQHDVAVAAAGRDGEALRGRAQVVPRAGEVGEDVLRRAG